MVLLRQLFVLLFCFFTFSVVKASDQQNLCGIEISSQKPIKFTSVEKNWLCGSGDNPAWQNIPATQKTVFLKSFLQSRGYHTPKIEIVKNLVVVDSGPQYFIQKFEVLNAPEKWDWKKRRKLIGLPLVPDHLTEFQKWGRRRLQEHSYACPQVDAKAYVEENKFSLSVQSGASFEFGAIKTIGEDDLNPDILDRFTAFFPDQEFDIRLLEITANRILAEDLYLSTYYDVLCDDKGQLEIVRRLIPAKPRLLTFGLGFDTEGGGLFRATLKQARLNKSADSLQTSIYASLIEQTLNLKYLHYFSSDLRSRLHVNNSLTVKRETEDSYEALTSTLGASLAYGWEKPDYTSQVQVGPYLDRTEIIVGPGPSRVDTVRINAEATLTSHLFEYFLSEPQEGWTVQLKSSTQLQGALSEENVHRVTLQHQFLWNLNEQDPAFLVLAWRGFAGTFFIDNSSALTTDIPITQKFFLGGDADIRGFGRKQIQAPSGEGYLTSLYQGLELRTGDVFPYHLQPLIFFDYAQAGETSARLQDTVYYAPGIGVRWASPIGSVRATLARGFIANASNMYFEPGYQFYFSFGKEF